MFPGVAHRPADRGAATEPDDADRAIERVTAADFVEGGGVLEPRLERTGV